MGAAGLAFVVFAFLYCLFDIVTDFEEHKLWTFLGIITFFLICGAH